MSDLELSINLLDKLSTKDKKCCIETLIKIHRNIASNPHEAKYRKLKLTNQRFNNEVWTFEGASMFMFITGWETQDNCIVLPPDIDVSKSLQLLVQNRNVKPDEREWVEENKIIGVNAVKLREEELRRKALIQKEKDMADLKKDIKERKAIANRILNEHRMDKESKRVTTPSKATPRRDGGSAKMADRVKSNEASGGGGG